MDYKDAFRFLDSLQSTNIDLGLERITKACELLGQPQKKFSSVIVAGTNGKGSTCAFLESIFRHHGLKVGFYISPHLVDVRERIQINRELISENDFAKITALICHPRPRLKHSGVNSSGDPEYIHFTYFEFLTAMAFQYFAEQKIDIAVLEVGLGGRFDATNIVEPCASVITRIGMDHQKYLGDTIDAIAFEKCGIIKKGVPIVTVDQEPAAMDVIRRVADDAGAMLHIVSPFDVRFPLGLAGPHQLENAACALRAAELVLDSVSLRASAKQSTAFTGLLRRCTPRNDTQIIASALSSTKWPGRLETISKKPLVILDGAHNPNGAQALARHIKNNFAGKKVIIMLGIMADKDIEGIIRPLNEVADEWVATRPDIARAAAADDVADVIKSVVRDKNVIIRTIEPIKEALSRTVASMKPDDVLIITGSLYMAGEVRQVY